MTPPRPLEEQPPASAPTPATRAGPGHHVAQGACPVVMWVPRDVGCEQDWFGGLHAGSILRWDSEVYVSDSFADHCGSTATLRVSRPPDWLWFRPTVAVLRKWMFLVASAFRWLPGQQSNWVPDPNAFAAPLGVGGNRVVGLLVPPTGAVGTARCIPGTHLPPGDAVSHTSKPAELTRPSAPACGLLPAQT